MSVINRAKLNAVLQMSQQHQAQLLQMMTNMLDAAEHTITQIHQYVQQQQWSELQQTLHKIRGGYATLGAEKLAGVSKALEHLLEINAPVDETTTAEFIATYRQTCAEMRAEITSYRQDSTPPQQAIDINRLYSMLIQQDMQACQLVLANQNELNNVLSPAVAASFSKHVTALEFASAAQILEPHLTPNRRMQP